MDTITPTAIERFARRFAGYTKAYGTYEIKDDGSTPGKKNGKARTVAEEVTLELFEAHLRGEGKGIGILPLDDDELVRWGCIDVDDYTGDGNGEKAHEFAKLVARKNLPLVVCRSKSGGAHCFLFLREPSDPKAVRDFLKRCTHTLGLPPDTEIFPKQVMREEGQIGNWLNLPYFYTERTSRYAIDGNGAEMLLEEFLDAADAAATSIDELGGTRPAATSVVATSEPSLPSTQPATSTGTEETDALAFLDRAAAQVEEAGEGRRNNQLNKSAYTVGGLIAAGVLSEDAARTRLLEAADEAGLPRREAERTITSGFKDGKERPWTPRNMLDPADPMRTADKLLDAKYMSVKGERTLHRHRETFWAWNGACYEMVEREDIAAVVWAYTENAIAPGKNGAVPFKPTNEKVQGIIHALKARSQLSSKIDFPAWLTEDDQPPPSEFMSVKNGLLHLPTGELWRPAPSYFNTSASRVAYDATSPEPKNWLAFLDQVFGDDKEARDAIQEFIGYCLLPDTSQQKMLLVVGPPRSGKGTIGRVLRELVGADSVAGPTMHSLSGEFGLEPLIPRPVAIISDARIGARTDKAAVTERLLSISGEDTLSVNRKNTSFWHGRLLTRFIILTNELPALSDGSGALANRFIIVVMKTSFLGKEDPGLFDKLKAELPGILNWAIAGYERLRARGHFLQPTSGREALDEIQMLASPVKAFVTDYCEVGPGYVEAIDHIWDAWKAWCVRSGNMTGSRAWLGRNLKSALPGVTDGEAVIGGERTRVYRGIRLRPVEEAGRPPIKDEEMPF